MSEKIDSDSSRGVWFPVFRLIASASQKSANCALSCVQHAVDLSMKQNSVVDSMSDLQGISQMHVCSCNIFSLYMSACTSL